MSILSEENSNLIDLVTGNDFDKDVLELLYSKEDIKKLKLNLFFKKQKEIFYGL